MCGNIALPPSVCVPLGCASRRKTSACTGAIVSLPLATLKELAKFSAPKARGVIPEQLNYLLVIKNHVTKGNSLMNENLAAFDLSLTGPSALATDPRRPQDRFSHEAKQKLELG